jgi:hypothetical protein
MYEERGSFFKERFMFYDPISYVLFKNKPKGVGSGKPKRATG